MKPAFILFAIVYLLIITDIRLMSEDLKNWKLYVVIYIGIIFVSAYIYNPPSGGDLERYFQMLQFCKGNSFSDSSQILNTLNNDNLVVRNFIFWLISNYFSFHLLPAISTATVYGVGAYIVGDFSQSNNKINDIPKILLWQFMGLSYFAIVANVRNIWAFSLIILAAYREIIKNKKNILTLALYIAPCFLHTSAIVLILIRLILPIIKRLRYLLPLLIFLTEPLILFLYNNIGKIPSIFVPAINSAYNYLFLSTAWEETVNSSTIFLLQKILMVSIAIIIIIVIYLSIHELSDSNLKLEYFELSILLLCIASTVFTSPHYWRFYSAGVILIAPTIVIYSNLENNVFLLKLYKLLTLCLFATFIYAIKLFA